MNRTAIAAALGSAITGATSVSGGDINDAHRVTLADGRTLFVKTNTGADAAMFRAEADGLAWLFAAASSLVIPEVVAVDDDFLALAWLDLDGRPDPAALGRGLAELHRAGARRFGEVADNFLATLPQDNTSEPDWPTFYVERRLRPLCRRARLGVDRELDAMRARPDRFGPAEPPARLHGDLWWGNVGAVGGRPAIFDPAVYGGHREIDLAMLALFGPLPDALIAAYDEVFPLADGWRDRLELHQVYPLAAHACLFGGGYGAQVRAVLSRHA